MMVLLCHGALGQLPCAVTTIENFLQLNTTTETVSMSCVVPADIVLDNSEQFLWRWIRLGPGQVMLGEITDSIRSGKTCM